MRKPRTARLGIYAMPTVAAWLPVEDYFQTRHGLVIPADLIPA